MLYATISRLDSLREIEMAMIAESRKLSHLRLATVPKRSALMLMRNAQRVSLGLYMLIYTIPLKTPFYRTAELKIYLSG